MLGMNPLSALGGGTCGGAGQQGEGRGWGSGGDGGEGVVAWSVHAVYLSSRRGEKKEGSEGEGWGPLVLVCHDLRTVDPLSYARNGHAFYMCVCVCVMVL